MIESYSFGEIEIDGKKYTNDVILFPDRVVNDWWRKTGHSLSIDDIEEVVKEEPEVLVVGTGAYGRMNVPSGTKDYLKSEGIELIVKKTKNAYKTYNELKNRGRDVVGAFHLTC